MKDTKIISNIDQFEENFIKPKEDNKEEINESDESDLIEDLKEEDLEMMDEVKNLEDRKSEEFDNKKPDASIKENDN